MRSSSTAAIAALLLTPVLAVLPHLPVIKPRQNNSICTIGTGQSGECMSTSSCADSGGISTAGFCTSATDIQCCTYGECSAGGVSGLCQPTSSCDGGSTTAGLCPGASNIECCTYGLCTVSGVSGVCKLKSLCSGVTTAGYCPGPNNIECCTGSGPTPCIPGVNQATLNLTETSEGWSPTPYPDPDGNPTIGYGHECQTATCSEIPYAIPLSYADGQLLLQSDLNIAETCITNDISDSVTLNPNQYGALVDWAFNVGCGNAGSSTLVRELNEGEDPETVVSTELPKWVYGSGPDPLPGLVIRRNAEVQLFNTSTTGVSHPPSC